MLTFNNIYSTYLKLTKDDSTANTTLGKLLINDTQKNVCGLADWTFLDDEWYTASVANQEVYRLPHNLIGGSVGSVYVENDDVKYSPKEIHSVKEFDQLSADVTTSDFPQYYMIYNDCIYFYPEPADTSWEIHLKYRKMALEMTADDYSTGTVSITQNTSNLTGLLTTFTNAMEGRWIKMPDGLWYELKTYNGATSFTLTKTYEGETVTNGSYTIGECPIIPDGFQEILLYKPLEHYFMMTGEEKRSVFYKQLYDVGLRDLKSRFLSRSANQVFVQGELEVKNQNDYPTNLS